MPPGWCSTGWEAVFTANLAAVAIGQSEVVALVARNAHHPVGDTRRRNNGEPMIHPGALSAETHTIAGEAEDASAAFFSSLRALFDAGNTYAGGMIRAGGHTRMRRAQSPRRRKHSVHSHDIPRASGRSSGVERAARATVDAAARSASLQRIERTPNGLELADGFRQPGACRSAGLSGRTSGFWSN